MKLGNMSPSLAMNNAPYSLNSYVVHLCNRRKVHSFDLMEMTNVAHRIFVQLGLLVVCADMTETYTQHLGRMMKVFGSAHIFQIVESIVGFVAVAVINLLAVELFAQEGGSNKDVYVVMVIFALCGVVQFNAKIAQAVNLRLENPIDLSGFATFASSHLPKITDLIYAFIANHITPFFDHRQISCGKKVALTHMSRKSDQTRARKGNGKPFYRAFETVTNSFGRKFIIPQEVN